MLKTFILFEIYFLFFICIFVFLYLMRSWPVCQQMALTANTFLLYSKIRPFICILPVLMNFVDAKII